MNLLPRFKTDHAVKVKVSISSVYSPLNTSSEVYAHIKLKPMETCILDTHSFIWLWWTIAYSIIQINGVINLE